MNICITCKQKMLAVYNEIRLGKLITNSKITVTLTETVISQKVM